MLLRFFHNGRLHVLFAHTEPESEPHAVAQGFVWAHHGAIASVRTNATGGLPLAIAALLVLALRHGTNGPSCLACQQSTDGRAQQ